MSGKGEKKPEGDVQNVGQAVDFLFDTEIGKRKKEEFDGGALVVPLWVRQRRASWLSESLFEIRESYELPEGQTDTKLSCQTERVGTEVTFKISHIDASFLSDLRMQMFYEPLQFKVPNLYSELVELLPSRPADGFVRAASGLWKLDSANYKPSKMGFQQSAPILACCPLSVVAAYMGGDLMDYVKNLTPVHMGAQADYHVGASSIFEYDSAAKGALLRTADTTAEKLVAGNVNGTVLKYVTGDNGGTAASFLYAKAAMCVAIDQKAASGMRPGLCVGVPAQAISSDNAYALANVIVYAHITSVIKNVPFKTSDDSNYMTTVLVLDHIHPTCKLYNSDYLQIFASAAVITDVWNQANGFGTALATDFYTRGESKTYDDTNDCTETQLCLYAPLHFLALEDLFGQAFLRDLSETDPETPEFNAIYHFSPYMPSRDVMYKSDLALSANNDVNQYIKNSGFYKYFNSTVLPDDSKTPYLQVANRNRFIDQAENHMVHFSSNYQASDFIKEGCIYFAPKFAIDGTFNTDIKENLGLTDDDITATTAQIFLPGLRYRPDFWSHFSKFSYTYAGNDIVDCIPEVTSNNPYMDGWTDLEPRLFYPKQNLLRAGSERKLNFRKSRKTTEAVPDSYVDKSRNNASYGFGLVQFSCPLPNMRQGEGRLHNTVWPLRAQTNDPIFKVTFKSGEKLVSDEDDLGRSYGSRLGIGQCYVGDKIQAKAVYTQAESDKLLRQWLHESVPKIENEKTALQSGILVNEIPTWNELSERLPIAYNILTAIRDFAGTKASEEMIKCSIKHCRCVAEKQIVSKDMESAFVNKYTQGVVIPVPRILPIARDMGPLTITNNVVDINLGGSKLDVEIVKAFIVGVRRKEAIDWEQRPNIDEISDSVAPHRMPYYRNYGHSPMQFLPVIEGMDFMSNDSSLFTRTNNSMRSVRDHLHFRCQYAMQDTQVIHSTGPLQNLVYWCITSDMLLAFYGMDRRSIDMNQIVHPKIRLQLKSGVQKEGLELVIYAVTQNGLIKMSGNEEMIMKQNGAV
uniref:Uncharacterized protein n=1 Tax=Palpitomonas bilix TaxID=652834 RepID=A0A7S3GCG6_9EUKA|mmetsp:Transcript_43390/g.112875  ORF Transcript_43390/g.112875 Transcript_43390/m.112875 type:complete len:1028 (+) Transcript_43390:2169-5252(+)